MTVHLMGDTEPTPNNTNAGSLHRHYKSIPDIQTVPAEVEPTDRLERATAALVPYKVEDRAVKGRGHWRGGD